MADTLNPTNYQCYACGTYLMYNETKGYYICPHCGIIQFAPIEKFDNVEES